MNSRADEAVGWFRARGALKTATPCSVQAARSILSYPAPDRPITTRSPAPRANVLRLTQGRSTTRPSTPAMCSGLTSSE